MLTSGLVDGDGAPGEPVDLDPNRSRERLAQTAQEISRQASDLHERVVEDIDDLPAHVVGGAIRMQELVDDLLAFSRYANESAAGAAALGTMMPSGSHTD